MQRDLGLAGRPAHTSPTTGRGGTGWPLGAQTRYKPVTRRPRTRLRSMRFTKFGHACVRLEHDGATLVIDPGTWTEREAVDGATAVLITHEHPDHYLPDHLLAT